MNNVIRDNGTSNDEVHKMYLKEYLNHLNYVSKQKNNVKYWLMKFTKEYEKSKRKRGKVKYKHWGLVPLLCEYCKKMKIIPNHFQKS